MTLAFTHVQSETVKAFSCGDILNIDKPQGITSFTAVRLIRKWSGCKKVGHAGTLDPMATGVLIVCTGKSTKKVQELMGTPKHYEGIISLGTRTNTDDAEGTVIEQCAVPSIDREIIETVLHKFVGIIDQVPPDFSAIRKNGVRMYRLARQGKKIEIPPRKVTINHIELLDWNASSIKIQVHCEKGTYIRSLARDIGYELGTCAHLSYLRRLGVGSFHVEEAIPLDSFKLMMLDHAHLSNH